MISSSPTRRGINIFAAKGSPVVAVNDGVIVKSGDSKLLGNYVVLRDAYGNRYTYAKLGRVVRKQRAVVMPTGKERQVPVDSENIRPRLYALPNRAPERDQSQAYERVDKAGAKGSDGTLKVGSRVIAGTVLARIGGPLGRRRPPHQLLDPAGRPRRPPDRPEADPRRLEAARGDRDLPRQGQEPAEPRS